jgi:hypothetical protein
MAASSATPMVTSMGQAWRGRAVLRLASPAPRTTSVSHYQMAAPVCSLRFISGLFGRQDETEKVVAQHDPSSEVGLMIQCQWAQYPADVSQSGLLTSYTATPALPRHHSAKYVCALYIALCSLMSRWTLRNQPFTQSPGSALLLTFW